MHRIKPNARTNWLAALLLLLLASAARADVRLPHVFGDHMVLQRDRELPVWGWANAGEAITVKLADKSATATADANGRWRVKLPALSAGGPHELVVSDGKNTLKLKDVLVGEVWICSGQSNMEWPLELSQRARVDLPKATNPRIRLLTIPRKIDLQPQADCDTQWKVCSPDNAKDFSAVGYYFGQELCEKLDVPVGMIDTSWGGTSIEPWTPRIGFESVPELSKFVNEIDSATAAYRRAFADYVDRVAEWLPAARDAATQDKDLPPLPGAPSTLPTEKRWPSGMYNGMIHPLIPFAMRGVIWYQGEANHGNGMVYFDKMKALIAGWRSAWGQGDFPFFYVQLARFANYHGTSLEDLWEAQLAALSIPNTGMAVTTDIVNDVTDAHPVNKHDVGHRLALWALAKVYGKSDLVYSGPLYKSSSVEGNKMRVKFDHVGSGLTTRDGLGVNSFQIGANGKFVPAKAKIDGDSVLVWSEEVANPTAVRFGWNKVANPNLMNKEGLPAAPFRSDPSATKR